MSINHSPSDHRTTRDRILDIAVAALETGGEASIRVNDIAQQAHVAVTSLYHYFGNREGLVAAAHILRYRRSTVNDFEVVRTRVAECTTLDEFRDIITAAVLGFLESPHHALQREIRIATYAAAVTRPEIAELLPSDLEVTADNMFHLLEPLKERGWVKRDADTRAFGVFYLGVMTGRIFIDIGEAPIDVAAYNRFVLNAVQQVVPSSESSN